MKTEINNHSMVTCWHKLKMRSWLLSWVDGLILLYRCESCQQTHNITHRGAQMQGDQGIDQLIALSSDTCMSWIMSMSPLVDKVGIQSWFEYFKVPFSLHVWLDTEWYNLPVTYISEDHCIVVLYLKSQNECSRIKEASREFEFYKQDL